MTAGAGKQVAVPFVDLSRVTSLVRDAVRDAWTEVVAAGELTGGPTVSAFERELGAHLGVRHVVGCSNGTDALVVGLQALGIGPGKRVALPNLTFWASYEAVVQRGAQAVLVDVDPEDLQLDPVQLARAHERVGLDAVLLVHLLGWTSSRLAEIRAWCQERELPLLEDAAQAFGVEVAGRSVLADAQLATLSFFPAKVLGGCMDGGALLTSDGALAARLRSLCNHGRSGHFEHGEVGHNARMGGLQAAWLRQMLRHAPTILGERRAHEAELRAWLDRHRPRVRPHGPPAGVTGNGYLSVCRVPAAQRALLARRLGEAGIAIRHVYPVTVADQPAAGDALHASSLEHSRQLCREVVNLPLFFGMRPDELVAVRQAFERALE